MKILITLLTILFLSSHLTSQEWVRQNPFANLSQMYDIDFDGKHGLAVGADATIFTTHDAGVTWIQRKPSDLARTIESALVAKGTMGQLMLAGGDSIIMVSRNGGETWKTSYVEIPNIYKIQELPGNIIFALGKDFGIYSLDDGITWQPFNMPAFGVTAGDFISIRKGWVALGEPDNVRVWYTSDGGFTWTIRDPQAFSLVSYIEMLNDTVGFLASKEYMYKTIDGGFSWRQMNSISTDHILDLHVIDEDHLWASLDNGSIFFTTSGGSVWEQIDPRLINSNRTLGIWANKAGQVWTVGKYLSILYSADFGQTWVDQLPANKQTLFEPHFYNAFTGMVGGSDGAILKTNNSGATWDGIYLPRNENFHGTVMLNDSLVFTASSSGKVYKSFDQGGTWSVIGTNLGSITDMVVFNQQSIIVTNTSGDIYKTSNGGTQWIRVHDAFTPLYAIDFISSQNGWAVGQSGKILMTNNGGDTWAIQLNEGRKIFSDVHFTSFNNGWVTTSTEIDSLWYTNNGGVTWNTVGLPVKSAWQGVAFMNQDTGWVIGGTDGMGIILRTDDKGLSWYVDHISPDVFMGIYVIPGSETVWAVGFGGNIMKFSSCASPPFISELRGNLEPCVGDTINYVVEFDDVDVFDWMFPADWRVLGNTNTASIYFIAGSMPGNVTVMGSDACGDTTIQTLVMVTPVNVPELVIREENGILVSNTTTGFYEWSYNGVIIPGANAPTYRPVKNGVYQLHYTTFSSGCETYSNIFRYGLKPNIFIADANLSFYPNPAKDFIIINYQDGSPIAPGAKVVLMDMNGRIVMNTISGRSQLNLPNVTPGFYLLQIQTETELMRTRIIIE